METRIVELILTHAQTGEGKEGDPFRLVTQLWTKDGSKVAERDPMEDSGWFNPHFIQNK